MIRTQRAGITFEYIPSRYIYFDPKSFTWNFHGQRRAGVLVTYACGTRRFIPNDWYSKQDIENL